MAQHDDGGAFALDEASCWAPVAARVADKMLAQQEDTVTEELTIIVVHTYPISQL